MRWLPGLRTLRAYDSHWLARDVFAGLCAAIKGRLG